MSERAHSLQGFLPSTKKEGRAVASASARPSHGAADETADDEADGEADEEFGVDE